MSKKKAKEAKKIISVSVIVAIVVAVLAVVGIVFAVIYANKPVQPAETSVKPSAESSVEEHSYAETSFDMDESLPYVMIEMEDGGKIVLELYPDIAPETVSNFLNLAESGFYDGLIFHRVIPGFMIQGGDPQGTGYGGSGTNIKGEFDANGFKNPLKHERGVISMARSSNGYDTASSQFFIMHVDYPSLNGQYAAFGRVVSGMDVVDQIASVETNPVNDKPYVDVVMKKVTVINKPDSQKEES